MAGWPEIVKKFFGRKENDKGFCSMKGNEKSGGKLAIAAAVSS
jgi:hypothetical protein